MTFGIPPPFDPLSDCPVVFLRPTPGCLWLHCPRPTEPLSHDPLPLLQLFASTPEDPGTPSPLLQSLPPQGPGPVQLPLLNQCLPLVGAHLSTDQKVPPVCRVLPTRRVETWWWAAAVLASLRGLPVGRLYGDVLLYNRLLQHSPGQSHKHLLSHIFPEGQGSRSS